MCLFFAHNSVATTQNTPAKTILILGDSISAGYGINPEQGWVALLQKRITDDARWRHYTAVNASISGNTTGDGLARLPRLLNEFTPAIVVIELGGNDGLRGYPVQIIKKNLKQLIAISQNANAAVVLAGIEIPPNYGPRYSELFRQAFAEVAATSGVAFIPFILQDIALTPALMQDDGIHPTAEAQAQLLDNIWPALEKVLP